MFEKLGSLVPKHQPPPAQDETSDVIARIWQAWKADHPDATLRDFWTAVGAGEVTIPPN